VSPVLSPVLLRQGACDRLEPGSVGLDLPDLTPTPLAIRKEPREGNGLRAPHGVGAVRGVGDLLRVATRAVDDEEIGAFNAGRAGDWARSGVKDAVTTRAGGH